MSFTRSRRELSIDEGELTSILKNYQDLHLCSIEHPRGETCGKRCSVFVVFSSLFQNWQTTTKLHVCLLLMIQLSRTPNFIDKKIREKPAHWLNLKPSANLRHIGNNNLFSPHILLLNSNFSSSAAEYEKLFLPNATKGQDGRIVHLGKVTGGGG